MKLLVDNALSPRVALALRRQGYDVVHVRELGMQASTDDAIVALASADGRTVVSADTDFGTILALRRWAKPSFVLLRGEVERRPEDQTAALLSVLPAVASDLERGAVVVIRGDRVRVRRLPIGSRS